MRRSWNHKNTIVRLPIKQEQKDSPITLGALLAICILLLVFGLGVFQ